MSDRPILLWLRRDLRLSDHPALTAACAGGRPVIPVFILDPETEAIGSAPLWRLGLALEHLRDRFAHVGSRMVFRRGPALEVLRELIRQTGASEVFWSRLYDPASIVRDAEIRVELKHQGIGARSFGGHVLFEPDSVRNRDGGYYRVFTPMWKAVRARPVETPLPVPRAIPAPSVWPASEDLADWRLGAAMGRGAAVLAPHQRVGEEAAQDRLGRFMAEAIDRYGADRDLPGRAATSGLSEHLTLGEISPHQAWHAGVRAQAEGRGGAEPFQRELVWREFACHLMYHTPHILTRSWRSDWDRFLWSADPARPEVAAWRQARTGVDIVDAGLREMYVTGRMHNRVRMIVASYLTKHLGAHWKIGMDWLADCLTDWDPASNALGWQWVAGCGPDAAPYFRVFNPATQAAKFDPDGQYRRRWIAEGARVPEDTALSYFEAVPRAWRMRPDAPYPAPVVPLAEGRERALQAYGAFKAASSVL